jgi:hypothetical protein
MPAAQWWLPALCVCLCVHLGVHAIEETIPFGEIRTMNADLLPTLLPSTAVLEILTETQPLGETVYEGRCCTPTHIHTHMHAYLCVIVLVLGVVCMLEYT